MDEMKNLKDQLEDALFKIDQLVKQIEGHERQQVWEMTLVIIGTIMLALGFVWHVWGH